MNMTTSDGKLALPKTERVFDMGSLMGHVSQLSDPRQRRGVRYVLSHLLVLLILAKLGGEDTLSGMADWVGWRGADLVKLLDLPRTSLPHQTTYVGGPDKLLPLCWETILKLPVANSGRQSLWLIEPVVLPAISGVPMLRCCPRKLMIALVQKP